MLQLFTMHVMNRCGWWSQDKATSVSGSELSFIKIVSKHEVLYTYVKKIPK